jgi:hypothetical protein
MMTRRVLDSTREDFAGRGLDDPSPEEAERARRAGYESDGDLLICRDPRDMSQDELWAMGHEAMSPIQAIRSHCLDCCAGSAHEVRCCVAMACPSWPFRTGKNPWREVSEGRREAGRRLAAKRLGRSPEPKLDLGENDGTTPAATTLPVASLGAFFPGGIEPLAGAPAQSRPRLVRRAP